MKKVSIVLPVYSTSENLDRCLESLVNQTLEEIEIVIVDDDSNEKSFAILKDYEKRYIDKIKVVKERAESRGVARNSGILSSSGEFIALVNSNDKVEPEMYEKLYKKAIEDYSDVVICDYYIMGEEKDELIESYKFNNSNNMDKNEIIYNDCHCSFNKIYRRHVFKNSLFPLSFTYPDLATVPILLHKARRISKVNEALYYYKINENSEINPNKTLGSNFFDIFKALDRLTTYFMEVGQKELIEGMYAKYAMKHIEYINNNKVGFFKKRKFRGIVMDSLTINFPNFKENSYFNK